MRFQEKLKDNSRHTLEAILQVMRFVVRYRKGQNQMKKNCSSSKEYLDWTTYLQPSVTRNAFNSFSRQSSEHHEAEITFFVQPDKMFLEKWTKVKETYFLTFFANKFKRKIQCRSKLASKLTLVYTVYYIPHFR